MADSLARLQAFLLRDRERYNALFTLVRRARPRLEAERFERNLAQLLAPLLRSFEGEDERALKELYPLLLDLTGAELFERSEAVRALWSELLPACVPLLKREPAKMVASLTNAIYNLEKEPGADWRFWLGRAMKCYPACSDAAMWLKACQVLAWVAGMAHFRESALTLSKELPESVCTALVPRWDKVKEDPWWARRHQSDPLIAVHKVGGFAGFDGPFQRPPEVLSATDERFWVSDGGDDWLLFSDGFGATLKRIRDFDLQEPRGSDVTVSPEGEVVWEGRSFFFPELAPVSGFAVSGQLLAITGRLTHKISILLRNF